MFIWLNGNTNSVSDQPIKKDTFACWHKIKNRKTSDTIRLFVFAVLLGSNSSSSCSLFDYYDCGFSPWRVKLSGVSQSKDPVIRATFSFNLHATLLRCKLKSVVGRITTHLLQQVEVASTFFNKFFQLATTNFVAWQCLRWVVIRATTLFNLQCNIVALQVAAICCSYYFTLKH